MHLANTSDCDTQLTLYMFGLTATASHALLTQFVGLASAFIYATLPLFHLSSYDNKHTNKNIPMPNSRPSSWRLTSEDVSVLFLSSCSSTTTKIDPLFPGKRLPHQRWALPQVSVAVLITRMSYQTEHLMIAGSLHNIRNKYTRRYILLLCVKSVRSRAGWRLKPVITILEL